MLIDATIPPPADAEARASFERIRPRNPHLRLEDFAAEQLAAAGARPVAAVLRLGAAAPVARLPARDTNQTTGATRHSSALSW